ncbi:putative prenylcysteine lyase [Talaromyces proteolyticus]|uniref:Prenylcysteine lyase n=1 Tax=Talaromyces proteolyticus TaxID=1131652 RepID=A0AAD4KJZ1_9EURO|nr:putative prenylcysteine lyase [Talaromyces proteolyticus]KAH8692996.1 putative prenylcysteine lyase [Talaromyces proteolyticus]
MQLYQELLCTLFLIWAAVLGTDAYSQIPLRSETDIGARKVAIIGAGSAGASTAYYLRQFADYSDIPLNITVFERSHYVGGRSITVDVFNDPRYPVELGASIFVSVNYNLMEAAKRFDLKISGAPQSRPEESQAMLGIWDGERFVYVQSHSMTWWDTAKLLWRYGLAPIRTQRLTKNVVGKFLNLYKPPYFPFQSLSSAVVELELHKATAVTGAQFLEANGISDSFSSEIIQASTRVNYGQNLGLIHGLETIVCMATDGAVAIEGGNWRIFSGMLDFSGAKLALNTTVTSITRNDDDTLTLSHITNNSPPSETTFDDVVIAAPYQSSGIEISPAFERVPDKIPYVKLYVTLFASPHQISQAYFNLSNQNEVPEMILTTLPKGVDLGSREDGVGPTGFWSISLLRVVDALVEGSLQNHYVYKVFSPERLSAEFVASILGVDSPAESENTTIGDLPSHHVSWFHEKTWHSYPYEYPRQTFEESKLERNVWYTGGIESFISTMETSSLMGMNVAGLMANEWPEILRPSKRVSWSRWFEQRNTEL